MFLFLFLVFFFLSLKIAMSTEEERHKVYVYYRDGKKQTVDRYWVNKGENKAKKQALEAFFKDTKLDIAKQPLKVFYSEFIKTNEDMSISFSMFYKYYVIFHDKVNVSKKLKL